MEIFRKFFAGMDSVRPERIDSAEWWEAIFDLKYRDIEEYHAAEKFLLTGRIASPPFAPNEPQKKPTGHVVLPNTNVWYRLDQRNGTLDVELIPISGKSKGDIVLRVEEKEWARIKPKLFPGLKRKRKRKNRKRCA